MRPLTTSMACALLVVGLPASTHADEIEHFQHTRYELLSPRSHAFRVIYQTSATTPGSTRFFNIIRAGSTASDIAVFLAATGENLTYSVVSGTRARAAGYEEAREDASYIQIELPAPVPSNGATRLTIVKTYTDADTYHETDDALLIFDRRLTIARNEIALPPGYRVTDLSYPCQLKTEADGRLVLSFYRDHPGAAEFRVEALPLAGSLWSLPAWAEGETTFEASEATETHRPRWLGDTRSEDSRAIIYWLQAPTTAAFRLYHDYTETREGHSQYLNWVRAGSSVSDPIAWDLDTGAELPVRKLVGNAITEAGLGEGRDITDDTEVVEITYYPVPPSGSRRIRIEETYTDASRYGLHRGNLLWWRAFGRSRNVVVLPEGYTALDSIVPATISTTEDGRQRFDFRNPRADQIHVLIRAREIDRPESFRAGDVPVPPFEVISAPQAERRDNMLRAMEDFYNKPEDESRLITYARTLAWYGRTRDSIDLYTQGLNEFPGSYRILRHRGHRYLSIRDFDAAVADLDQSAALLDQQWPTIEDVDDPKGHDATPREYLRAIWYHLGVSLYMARQLEDAERALVRSMEVAANDDQRCASAYWLVNTLILLDRADEIPGVLEFVTDDMEIEANLSYSELVMLHAGIKTLEETLDITDTSHSRFVTLGYGVSNWLRLQGRKEEARELLKRILDTDAVMNFGYIGAEIHLHEEELL